ncbi:MAG: DEAD/DEAH box helicase, partial [Betaproteobacteria bacterium]
MINESFTGLRPYQLAAIMDIDEQVKAGHKQIILYCPTGGGKTEIAIGLMKRAALQEGKRVLFVVDRIDLVHQAARRMYKSGLHCGIIQGGNSQDEDAQVIAGSIQTMHRRKAKQQFDLIIVDEAHKATSRVYREFLAHQPAIVIGLTATPFTQGLGTLFSKLIKSSSVADLVERKYLVDCDIYAPSTPDLRGVNIVRGDYDQAALGNRVNTVQLVGDIVSTWRAMASNRRTVVFATNVAHSKHIQQQFLSAGIACEHVDAYTDREERDAIYARLNSGETRVLTNVEVCSTGWDVPAVECMILARPTQSITLYVQMIGRVLRPAPGKERALVLDHSGSCV